jgi:hypothetical protein
MSEKPKRRSSAGADAILNPRIASDEYMTIFLDVSHQLVSNWKGRMIA